MLEVCSPNTGEILSTSGLTNGLDYRWEVSSDGLSDWETYVGTGDSGDITGGQAILNSVAVDQWYRLVVALDGNLNKTCVKISDSVQMVINPLPVIDSIGKNPYSSIYCKDEVYEVEAHLDELEGYPVTYQWSKDAFGTDSVFMGITTPGTHTYKVVVNAGNCLDSMEIQVYVAPSDSLIMSVNGDYVTCSNLTSTKSETEFDDFLEFDIIDVNGRLIKTGERGDWVPFYPKKKGLYFVRFKFNDGAIRIKKIISY